MPIATLPAIDVHAHLGVYAYGDEFHRRFMSGHAGDLVHLGTLARTDLTIVSSLEAVLPEGAGDAIAGNEIALRAVEGDGRLRLWAVLDPRRRESFDQVERLLEHPRCVGIKIHPELHEYPIADYGRAIFEFAARRRTVVETHSGQQRSMPADFVPFADGCPEVTLILSHLGYCWNEDFTQQVRAIQSSRNGHIYTDTSSAKSITPNLLEWAVSEVGADRILYGTDSPLYFAPMQRARVDYADLRDDDKRMILRGNAERLLSLATD
jgi:hypothetical protein